MTGLIKCFVTSGPQLLQTPLRKTWQSCLTKDKVGSTWEQTKDELVLWRECSTDLFVSFTVEVVKMKISGLALDL